MRDGSVLEIQVRRDVPLSTLLERFAHLTSPDLRRLAASRALREPLLVAAARLDGELVGGAIAERGGGAAEATAQVLSLFVQPAVRGGGIGGLLVSALENELRNAGVREVGVILRDSAPQYDAAVRVLRRVGWLEPEPRRVVCRLSTAGVHSWLAQPLAAGFSMVPWYALDEAAVEELVGRAVDDGMTPELDPRQLAERREDVNSLALLEDGYPVGWLITHRQTRETIQYSTLWIAPGRRRRAQALALVADAGRRQVEARVPGATFMVDVANAPMLRLLERRLAAGVAARARLLWARKVLDG